MIVPVPVTWLAAHTVLIVMWSQFAFVKERASNYWNKVTKPKVHAVMSPTSVAKVPEWVRDLYTRAALW
jgi:hypothetical protein